MKLTVIISDKDNDLLKIVSKMESKSKAQIVREAIRLYAALKILMRNPKIIEEYLTR
jgi:vacuolar-type H+-ATPase subunit E/Vma4